jgi:hypothetical protein
VLGSIGRQKGSTVAGLNFNAPILPDLAGEQLTNL